MILFGLALIFVGCVAFGVLAFVGIMGYAIYSHYNLKPKAGKVRIDPTF